MSNALKPLNENLVSVLVENHRNFRAFLARRVGNDAMAEDLLQTSLKKAIESPAAAYERTSVVAWFYAILRNTLTDYYRSQAAEGRKLEGFHLELGVSRQVQQSAADEIEAAVCECLNALLPTLKENYAEALQRIDLNGEGISVVANELGISENNMSVRLYRAREALRISLERTCGTCTEHGCLNCTCK